jgi:hypothetical protein
MVNIMLTTVNALWKIRDVGEYWDDVAIIVLSPPLLG